MKYAERYLRLLDETVGNIVPSSVLIYQKRILVKRVNVLYVEKHTYELESLNTVVENARHINIIIYKKRIAVSDVEKNLYEIVEPNIAQMSVNLSGAKSI